MPRDKRPQFFISILSAIIVGVGTAYIGIFGIQMLAKPQMATKTFTTITSAFQGFSSLHKLSHPLSATISYAAEDIREEVGSDITLTGETISATNSSKVDSSGAAISALAYSVQSLDRDNVLIEKDADRLMPIASVTKLVTAVLAKKLFTNDDDIKITAKALAVEGSTGGLRLNEVYSVKEILYPLLMVSSNDAAQALADAYDKTHGTGKFIQEMNAWATSIGAFRTYFRDASGLSAQNVSTAHDLSIIAKWIKENDPAIFDVTLTKSKSLHGHTWTNPTHFLNLSSYTGGKNGYTTEAHLTNLSLFSLGEPKRLFSVVLLGSANRDKDTIAVLNEAVK